MVYQNLMVKHLKIIQRPMDFLKPKLSIISHSHSELYNLFNDSNTKLIAFESKKPVMCFHA